MAFDEIGALFSGCVARERLWRGRQMIKLPPGKFFGDVQSERDANHLTFSESQYAGGNTIPLHSHENPFFCLILDGQSTETVAGESRLNAPSALVYHPAEEPHANEWHSDGRCFHIEIGVKRWAELTREARLLTNSSVFLGGTIVALAHRIHHEFANADAFSGLVLDGLVLQLLGEASRPSDGELRMPRWLWRVRELLHESYDSSLTMSDIADSVGVHPAHLSRTFRKFFRQTPGEYVRRMRVEAAANLLAKSSSQLQKSQNGLVSPTRAI
jgi:AraC family transcriptional regulator